MALCVASENLGSTESIKIGLLSKLRINIFHVDEEFTRMFSIAVGEVKCA